MSSHLESILDLGLWNARVEALASAYRAAEPFPHLVLDEFLRPAAAAAMLREFPSPDRGTWIHYDHVNEHKLGLRDRAAIPPSLLAAIEALDAPPFVSFLERVTGIPALLADESLEGGGLHQCGRGGFLNVHADFTVHPRHRDWRRRVNVLLYLNRDWPDAWGGHLELWDAQVKRCVRRIAPAYNRAVIFGTGERTFHGHPDPIVCPEGHTRKSLALYYFTREASPIVRSTEYRARPGDGARALLIRADTLALRAYDRVKRRLGLDERFVSGVLGAMARWRRR